MNNAHDKYVYLFFNFKVSLTYYRNSRWGVWHSTCWTCSRGLIGRHMIHMFYCSWQLILKEMYRLYIKLLGQYLYSGSWKLQLQMLIFIQYTKNIQHELISYMRIVKLYTAESVYNLAKLWVTFISHIIKFAGTFLHFFIS